MDDVGPEQIRIAELFKRLKKDNVSEVILATSTSVEGEATSSFLAEKLKNRGVAVSRIASGVPMGGDLKFVGAATLKRAMDRRYKYE